MWMMDGSTGQVVVNYANEQLALMRLASELNGKISAEDLAALSEAFEAKKTGDMSKAAQLTEAQQAWFPKYETYRNSQQALLDKMRQLDEVAQVDLGSSIARVTLVISQITPKNDMSPSAPTCRFTPSASSSRETPSPSKQDDDPKNFGKGWLKPGFYK